MRVSRRSLIAGLGLGASSLGLPRWRPRTAHAAGAIPKRFVVFVGNGMIYDEPWPVAPGGGAPGETGWQLGAAHAPLQSVRERCTYVDGVGMVSQEVDTNKDQGNAHQQGSMHCLAATNTVKSALPGGPSIDQVIAQAQNSPNPVTKLRSLELLVGCWAGDMGEKSYSSSAANTLLPLLWSPKDVYARVFGDFKAPSGGGPSLADVQRQQQLAVMGLTKNDFAQLSMRLGKDDRARLDAHQSLLSDLEARMKLLPSTGASCAAPMVPSSFPACTFTCWSKQYTANYETSDQYNMRIAAAALACDLTRVISVALQPPDEMTSFKSGMAGNSDLHGLTHMVCDRSTPASKDPTFRKAVRDANVVEASTVASFCQQLAQIPEADGQTLLDHTVVLFAGHIGYGSHYLGRLPWVVIGGKAAGIKQGRYIKLPAYAKSERGRPHNDLFLTLAKAVGVDLPAFGNPALCSGPIDELLT